VDAVGQEVVAAIPGDPGGQAPGQDHGGPLPRAPVQVDPAVTLGAPRHGAGVDHQDVGRLVRSDEGHRQVGQGPAHGLAVGLVHLAARGLEGDPDHVVLPRRIVADGAGYTRAAMPGDAK
jgi:hypothetical protein